MCGTRVFQGEDEVIADAVWACCVRERAACPATGIGFGLSGVHAEVREVPDGVAVVGAGLIVGARVMLARARTTWRPGIPGRRVTLVSGGVYRFSRNPMYLGMQLLLLGWAAALMSPVALGVSVLFIPYMDRFQTGPEERALSALFGQSYRDYLSAVRRWL